MPTVGGGYVLSFLFLCVFLFFALLHPAPPLTTRWTSLVDLGGWFRIFYRRERTFGTQCNAHLLFRYCIRVLGSYALRGRKRNLEQRQGINQNSVSLSREEKDENASFEINPRNKREKKGDRLKGRKGRGGFSSLFPPHFPLPKRRTGSKKTGGDKRENIPIPTLLLGLTVAHWKGWNIMTATCTQGSNVLQTPPQKKTPPPPPVSISFSLSLCCLRVHTVSHTTFVQVVTKLGEPLYEQILLQLLFSLFFHTKQQKRRIELLRPHPFFFSRSPTIHGGKKSTTVPLYGGELRHHPNRPKVPS
mmetsp:Transcript_11552/g.30726  ORF Transcript_11552/g.30726 Transcript_11552/m.30726 type:complete len:303 (+) Transcript_11552:2131-3039(+)